LKLSKEATEVPKKKGTIRRSRFSNEQMTYALRHAESGAAVADV
jgi:hypothetical protein